MEPSSFPNGLNITSPFLHDVFEAHPPIVECPRGTVPILRNSRMKHIAGQLYINAVISKDNQQEVNFLLFHFQNNLVIIGSLNTRLARSYCIHNEM